MRWNVNVLLAGVDISHFYITWVISEQFSCRGFKPVTFLVQFIRYRSSRQEVFCKKGVIRNFAKFTGKHMFQDLFFNKVVLTPFLGFFELLFLLITFFINFCLTVCLNTLLNFSRSTLLYNRIYCIKHVFDNASHQTLAIFQKSSGFLEWEPI